jgi:hypothetical protein
VPDVADVYDAEAEQMALARVVFPRYERMLTAVHQMVASNFPELSPDEFRLDDAATRRVLAKAAEQVVMIDEATRKALREVLQEGQQRGYSDRQIADGVPKEGYGGIDGLYLNTWRSRAETIARTEVSTAQVEASLDRYKATGLVSKVEIVEHTDTDAQCAARNGTTVSLTSRPGLLHPNCRVALVPIVDDLPVPARPEPVAPAAPWLWDDDETRFDVQGKAAKPGWEAVLTEGERGAVKSYTTGGYRDLNERLREGAALTAEQTRLKAQIDAALEKAGEYAEPVTVWRGVNLGNAGMPPGHELAGRSQAEREALVRRSLADYAQNRFAPGDTLELGGFQSTSFRVNPALDASVSKTSPGIVFEIRAKRGGYLAPPLTAYDDEAELLLGEATRYRVVKVLPDVAFERDEDVVVRRTVVELEQL